jgi:hypothetical protein
MNVASIEQLKAFTMQEATRETFPVYHSQASNAVHCACFEVKAAVVSGLTCALLRVKGQINLQSTEMKTVVIL